LGHKLEPLFGGDSCRGNVKEQDSTVVSSKKDNRDPGLEAAPDRVGERGGLESWTVDRSLVSFGKVGRRAGWGEVNAVKSKGGEERGFFGKCNT